MSFEDWQKYFHDFDICYYHDNFVHSNKLFCSSPSAPTVIRWTINRPGDYYFMVSQVNARQFAKADRYTYTSISLTVARMDGGNINHVGTSAKDDQLNWFKATCQPGNYVAYIETPWKRNVNQFGFTIYGPEQVNFEAVDPSSIPGGFQETIVKDKARKETQHLKNYAPQGEPAISYRFETSAESFSYFYFSNKSPGTTLKATVQMVECVGIEVLPPYTGQRNPEVTVSPGQEQIVICKPVGGNTRLAVRVAAQFMKGGAPPSRHIRDIGGDHGHAGFGGGGYGGVMGGNYGTPSPSPAYGGPGFSYSAPDTPGMGNPGFGSPSAGFGGPAPSPGYGAPSPGFGDASPGFGAPSPGFGSPSPSFGGPSPSPGFGGSFGFNGY